MRPELRTIRQSRLGTNVSWETRPGGPWPYFGDPPKSVAQQVLGERCDALTVTGARALKPCATASIGSYMRGHHCPRQCILRISSARRAQGTPVSSAPCPKLSADSSPQATTRYGKTRFVSGVFTGLPREPHFLDTIQSIFAECCLFDKLDIRQIRYVIQSSKLASERHAARCGRQPSTPSNRSIRRPSSGARMVIPMSAVG